MRAISVQGAALHVVESGVGDGPALVEPQGLERQPGMPEVDPIHGLRRLGEGPGGARARP